MKKSETIEIFCKQLCEKKCRNRGKLQERIPDDEQPTSTNRNRKIQAKRSKTARHHPYSRGVYIVHIINGKQRKQTHTYINQYYNKIMKETENSKQKQGITDNIK